MAPIFADPRGAAAERTEPIETLRALAVLLLVFYHVVGSGPTAGLEIDYPHPLRTINDLMVDLRMPTFAFVAGYVYAIRPVAIGAYGGFMTGKVRRLLVPGAVAVTLFALAATLTGMSMALDEWARFWRIYLFPYAHFWFLQAIFLIFSVLALIEARTGPRAAWALLAAAVPLYLLDLFPPGNPFAVKQAVYLAPYFLCGVLYRRHLRLLRRHGRLVLPLCLALAAVALWLPVEAYRETGAVPGAKRDLQSLALGMAAPVALMLVLPNLPWLSRFGAASFTIYLYHVFGTSGMRQVLEGLGISSLAVLVPAGIAAGIALPLALHALSERTGPTRRLVLGQRR
jgi:fucose 4-O-acetylase-like acetyltransferase